MERRCPIIRPLNLFMNTKVEALVNLHIGVAACSVSEEACNGGSCKPIRALVKDETL